MLVGDEVRGFDRGRGLRLVRDGEASYSVFVEVKCIIDVVLALVVGLPLVICRIGLHGLKGVV